MAGRAPETENGHLDLPTWYYVTRAIVCLVVGAFLVIHEAFGTTPPGPFIYLTGLILMGFTARDVAVLFGNWKANGK